MGLRISQMLFGNYIKVILLPTHNLNFGLINSSEAMSLKVIRMELLMIAIQCYGRRNHGFF